MLGLFEILIVVGVIVCVVHLIKTFSRRGGHPSTRRTLVHPDAGQHPARRAGGFFHELGAWCSRHKALTVIVVLAVVLAPSLTIRALTRVGLIVAALAVVYLVVEWFFSSKPKSAAAGEPSAPPRRAYGETVADDEETTYLQRRSGWSIGAVLLSSFVIALGLAGGLVSLLFVSHAEVVPGRMTTQRVDRAWQHDRPHEILPETAGPRFPNPPPAARLVPQPEVREVEDAAHDIVLAQHRVPDRPIAVDSSVSPRQTAPSDYASQSSASATVRVSATSTSEPPSYLTGDALPRLEDNAVKVVLDSMKDRVTAPRGASQIALIGPPAPNPSADFDPLLERAGDLLALALRQEHGDYDVSNFRPSPGFIERYLLIYAGEAGPEYERDTDDGNWNRWALVLDVSPEKLEQLDDLYTQHRQHQQMIRLAQGYVGLIAVFGGLAMLLRVGTGRRPEKASA